MPVFLVTPLIDNADRVATAVRALDVPDTDRFELNNPNGGWLVAFPGTTVDLTRSLKLASVEPGFTSPVGPALVTSVSSYFGLGQNVMWEWLKLQFERN